MKIIHIVPSLSIGSVEKFCIELANEMVKEHEVIICTLRPATDETFFITYIHQNIKLYNLDTKTSFDWPVFIKLYKFLKQEKADIVHTHLNTLHYLFISTKFIPSKYFHTIYHKIPQKRSFLCNKIYNHLFNKECITPVSVSNTIRESLQNHYGKQHALKIEIGITPLKKTTAFPLVEKEINALKVTPNTKVFIHIGTISSSKKQKNLIEIFKRLITQEGHDIILLLIGNTPSEEKEHLKRLKRESCKGIYFMGIRQNIADYLYCADAFCFLSEYIGSPTTLLEAMSAGCITISNPSEGIHEIIQDNENGILALTNNDNSYYQAIIRFLQMKEAQKQYICQNAKQNFQDKYTIKISTSKYQIVYLAKLNY